MRMPPGVNLVRANGRDGNILEGSRFPAAAAFRIQVKQRKEIDHYAPLCYEHTETRDMSR
jgi:hypothetical protein